MPSQGHPAPNTIKVGNVLKVLSIDPGITTGYVYVAIKDDWCYVAPLQAKHSPGDHYTLLWHGPRVDQLISEDFEIRPNSPAGLILFSCQLIGITAAYSEICKVPLKMQKAGYGKSHFADAKQLKEAGVYKPGAAWEHSMDAMRHFMQWYTFGPGYKYHVPNIKLCGYEEIVHDYFR